ncbi:glycosyltransferase family 2 protein [Salegentibacter sp. HM20]
MAILLSTHNRAHLIEETLNSIVAQTYKNWECIIVDDYSSDNTKETVERYIHRDKRFSYHLKISDYKKGLSGTRNYGLDLARERGAEFIQFYDDDDIVHPQNLQLCIKEFKSNNYDFCRVGRVTFTGNFTKDFQKINSYEINTLDFTNLEDIIIGKIPFNSCQVMWKEKCFENNKFNEDLLYAEEWELYSRILANLRIKGVSIQKTLYFARKHSKSNTGEFWRGNKKRFDSQIKAIKLVIKHLKEKDYLSETLIRYFVQMGIFLKEISIINYLFKNANISLPLKFRYYLLYYFYPIIGRLYRIKKRLTNG